MGFSIDSSIKGYISNNQSPEEFKNLNIGKLELAKICRADNFYEIVSLLKEFKLIKYYPFSSPFEGFRALEYYTRVNILAKKHSKVTKLNKIFPNSNAGFSIEEFTIVYWIFIFTSSHSTLNFKIVSFCVDNLLNRAFSSEKKRVHCCRALLNDLLTIHKAVEDHKLLKEKEKIGNILFKMPAGIKLLMLADVSFSNNLLMKMITNKLKFVSEPLMKAFAHRKSLSEKQFTPRGESYKDHLNLKQLKMDKVDKKRSFKKPGSLFTELMFKNKKSTLEVYNSHVQINKSFYCSSPGQSYKSRAGRRESVEYVKKSSLSLQSTASGNKKSARSSKLKKLKSEIGLSEVSNNDTIHETTIENRSMD